MAGLSVTRHLAALFDENSSRLQDLCRLMARGDATWCAPMTFSRFVSGLACNCRTVEQQFVFEGVFWVVAKTVQFLLTVLLFRHHLAFEYSRHCDEAHFLLTISSRNSLRTLAACLLWWKLTDKHADGELESITRNMSQIGRAGWMADACATTRNFPCCIRC